MELNLLWSESANPLTYRVCANPLTKVCPSQHHGLGLFATSVILKDQIAAGYPLTHVRFRDNCLCRPVWQSPSPMYSGAIEAAFPYFSDKTLVFYPPIHANGFYSGHYANDSVNGTGMTAEAYAQAAEVSTNAQIITTDSGAFIQAITDIAINEEIFVMYGHAYWNTPIKEFATTAIRRGLEALQL